MEPRKTLYFYVYEHLREQILNEQREYGSVLPSTRQLAKEYYVGIRTIKTVLQMLSKEGLIRTAERRHAVVIYKAPFTEKEQMSIQAIIKRRDTILGVYETMELLMPDVISFCSQSSQVYELDHYELNATWTKRRKLAGSWKSVSDLFNEVLRSSGNLLFNSMYNALEVHAEVPFLLEYQYLVTGYTPYQDNRRNDWIVNCLRSDRYTMRLQLRELFHTTTESMRKSFKRLEDEFPGMPRDTSKLFSWDASWGLDRIYKRVARILMERIGTGEYPVGELMPSVSALAHELDVSASTIRKALLRMSALNYIKTINGKGSVVLDIRERKIYQAINIPEYRQDILLYLSGLQLMAMAVRVAAPLAFDTLSEDQIDQTQRILLSDLIEHVIQQTPLYPLKVIMEETNKILHLGTYYSFYNNESEPTVYINSLCRKALDSLKRGDRQKFTAQLFQSYCYILDTIREKFLSNNFQEARCFFTPD